MTKNRPTIEDIIANPRAGQGLPLDVAADLIEEGKTRARLSSAAVKLIEGDVAGRFASQITGAFIAEGKDTGTVHVFADGFDLTADRPKKVEWSQDELGAVVDRIGAAGDDPKEYVEITFGVAERKFTAWPEHIRKQFEPARTVKPGALTIKLAPVAEQKAA